MEIAAIVAFVASMLTVIVPPIVNSMIVRRRTNQEVDKLRSESDALDAQTLKNLREQVREMVIENHSLRLEFEKLKNENRMFRNAYARAIKFIYEKDPLAAIPDFLKESEPKIKPVE